MRTNFSSVFLAASFLAGILLGVVTAAFAERDTSAACPARCSEMREQGLVEVIDGNTAFYCCCMHDSHGSMSHQPLEACQTLS